MASTGLASERTPASVPQAWPLRGRPRRITALSLWCTLRLSPTPLRLRSWARSRARFNGQAPLRLTKLSLPLSLCFVRERREYQPEGPNVKPTHDSGVGSRIQPWGFSPPGHFIYSLVGEGGWAIFQRVCVCFNCWLRGCAATSWSFGLISLELVSVVDNWGAVASSFV